MRKTRTRLGRTRRLMSVALTCALVVSVAACSSGGGSSSGAINVFLIPSPSATAIEKSIPAFEKATGIKVHYTETEYGTAHQKELLSIKAKQHAYDVVQFDNTFLASFAYAHALAPLDGYVKNSTAYDINDFSPSLQQYGVYRGATYGLVLSTEPFILWYRKDIFAKLGISVPTTWDEFKAASDKIKASGQAAGNIMGYGSATDWWWMQLVWSFGGQLYDSAYNPTVTTPEAVAATEYYKSLLHSSTDGALSTNGDDVTSIFTSKPVGEMIQYSGYAAGVFDPKTSNYADQIGTAPVPVGTVNATELAGWNIGIPADSNHKGNAWKFLEFVLGKAQAKTFLSYGAAAIGRKSITEDADLVAKNPYLKLLSLPATTKVFPYPHLVTWPEFDKACADSLSDIVAGKVGVQDGLNQLQAKLKTILAGEPKA